jgi:N-acetylmuramoyl-L-alanine amidase
MAREIGNAIKSYISSISASTEKIKDPEVKELEVEKAIETTKVDIYEGVNFKVQLAATSKKIDPKPSNFKGLKDVVREKEDGLFKYYYGETSDYNKIQVIKTFAQQKGYPSAYIVAFKKDRKVNISEVLKSKAN